MQPCTREMQAMNSILNQSQMSLQDQQIGNTPMSSHFDPTSSHADFLEQMLSSIGPPSCSWPDVMGGPNPKSPWDLSSSIGSPKSRDLAVDDQGPTNPENVQRNPQFQFEDQSVLLASKLRQHQISGGGANSAEVAAAKSFLQQQLLLQSRSVGGGALRSPTGGPVAGDTGLIPLPLSLAGVDYVAPNPGGDGSVQALYNGFAGSLLGSGQTSNQFHHPQGQNFGAAPVMIPAPSSSSAGGGTPGQPRQRVRARRGQATDPHSIAERLRRERIADRMKALQELVPNANKTDKASMLDEIIDYVKFLQLQVKVLSMSRLGGAAAVAPLVADISSEARASNGGQTASTSDNDSMTVTEHQVAKLMEEDMGSAMQYLQGKGLCLMPISLATAISTGTCHSRNPIASNANPLPVSNGVRDGNAGGPSSPSMSVLTVQSATLGYGAADPSVKDAASISKP